ncbi:hypothetical protein MMC08_001739 [Hypocenomyce scalaris]|nr:hypothetical protein [Hypocenomyce scalaris]
MRARTRQVNFGPATISRLPGDDEKYVMQEFARHASRCSACASPYSVHLAGGTLCPTGHQLAIDVAQYVYTQAGKAYSRTDRARGQQAVQIEIPASCQVVRGLLQAMDNGLRLRKATKERSFDRTYAVEARPVVIEERRPRAREESEERAPRLLRRPSAAAATGRREVVVGRGSLFDEDRREREKRERKAVYYEVERKTPRYLSKSSYAR